MIVSTSARTAISARACKLKTGRDCGMPIPVSAQAIMKVGAPERQLSGTLGEQILRYLSLDADDRGHTTITVSAVVDLPGWAAPRTFLDPEAIRNLARAMSSRGLI